MMERAILREHLPEHGADDAVLSGMEWRGGTGTLDRSKWSQDDEGGKLGCFLLQRGRLKWRESGRGCATRPTERIDDDPSSGSSPKNRNCYVPALSP